MTLPIGHEAARPNSALEPFGVLVGHWTTEGAHPMIPGVTLHGRISFEWILGGAFLLMRTEVDEPQIPSGLAILGTDDSSGACYLLYFDERGVSRKYDVSLNGGTWMWWRNDPEFSQRFTGTLSADRRAMTATGELSRKGGPWEPDLALTYTRS